MASSIKSWYTVVNTTKYIGTKAPYCRSTWELAFCRSCDGDPRVIKWAHEPLKILYINPANPTKYSVYVPDFFIMYVDKRGKKRAELIEIKPAKESNLKEAKSKRDKERVIVNAAKWQAAQEYCKKHGMNFKVITEKEMFKNG